jgi:hypothetical protein
VRTSGDKTARKAKCQWPGSAAHQVCTVRARNGRSASKGVGRAGRRPGGLSRRRLGGQVRIDPAFDFDPQRAAGPARRGAWDLIGPAGEPTGRGRNCSANVAWGALAIRRGAYVPCTMATSGRPRSPPQERAHQLLDLARSLGDADRRRGASSCTKTQRPGLGLPVIAK